MTNIFEDNTKKLGFGLMRLPRLDPNREDSIDVETLKKMVDTFIERGFTYFDTAWMYCGFKSENATKEALVDRYPRDKFTLADKLHGGFFNKPEEMDDIFNKQMEKTGVSFFDYYLLHDIGEDHYKKYTELGSFEWLAKKKEAGLVKHMGFSYHDRAELLDRVLTEHPEMEFVQMTYPSQQLSIYLSMVESGRKASAGFREPERVQNSDNKLVVIDNTLMSGTFGHPTKKRDWNALFQESLYYDNCGQQRRVQQPKKLPTSGTLLKTTIDNKAPIPTQIDKWERRRKHLLGE